MPPGNAFSLTEQPLRKLARRAKQSVDLGHWECNAPLHWLDTQRYRDIGRWQNEQRAIFRPFPLIAAHVDELPATEGSLEVSLAGRSLILTRSEDGRVRAFLNACRHRSMALLDPGESTCKSRLNCPYHGWSYGLDGQLKGIPHADAFPGLQVQELTLHELPCSVRHGLIWVQPDPQARPINLAIWLGGLDDDFTALDLGGLEIFRIARSEVQANWKLCVDAFLEAYHVKVLHRNSVGPFFEDALAVYDLENRHFRSGVARKGLDLTDVDAISLPAMRDKISFTHFVYPNHIFIFHPDYVSQTSIIPTAVDRFDWVHRMLIPRGQNTPERRPHWEQSFELIEQGVFQAEDLAAAEKIQRGLSTDSGDSIPIGQLEILIRAFHERLDRDMGAPVG